MTVSQLRQRITDRLQDLSGDKLQAAYHFVEYLHETDAATKELTSLPGLSSALERAERQAARGNVVALTKVRRDV